MENSLYFFPIKKIAVVFYFRDTTGIFSYVFFFGNYTLRVSAKKKKNYIRERPPRVWFRIFSENREPVSLLVDAAKEWKNNICTFRRRFSTCFSRTPFSPLFATYSRFRFSFHRESHFRGKIIFKKSNQQRPFPHFHVFHINI